MTGLDGRGRGALVNWALMVSVVTPVVAFGSSAARQLGSSASLAFAFGMAVTATITITTLLFLYLARQQRGWPLWVVLTGGGAMLSLDLLFFAANLTKLIPVVLPVHDRPVPRPGESPAGLAAAAVRGHLAADRRRRGLVRPAPRSDDHHRFAHRGLTTYRVG